jgi:peptidoglycan/LPS O-acetylase OafA/YrhL
MYYRYLDSYRLFACIAVVVFHVDFIDFGFADNFLQGGYQGVDFFFVLSGFVITASVKVKLIQNKFNGKLFLIRRIGRLMPAIFVLNMLLFAFRFKYSGDLWISGLFFSTTYLSNLFPVVNFIYGGGLTYPSDITQCWSLAVEEQFYIVYALIAERLFLFLKKRSVLFVTLLSVLVFFIVSFPSFVLLKSGWFYKFPLWRFAQIFLGVCIAIKSERFYLILEKITYRKKKYLLGILTFALILQYSVPNLTDYWFINICIFTMTSVLTILFVVVLDVSKTKIRTLKVFGKFAQYTYGIYLYHPIFLNEELSFPNQMNDELGLTLRMIILLVFSIISFHLIEDPIRRRVNSYVAVHE